MSTYQLMRERQQRADPLFLSEPLLPVSPIPLPHLEERWPSCSDHPNLSARITDIRDPADYEAN